MDASKALQALVTGDLVALIQALDTDRSAVMLVDGSEYLAMYRVGPVLIKRDLDVHGDGTHSELALHVYGSAAEAEESINTTIAKTQMGRGAALAGGLDVGQLIVDGIMVPAPELSIMDMLSAMAGYVGTHRMVEAPEPVTVPDTVPDGWGTV